MAMMKTIISLAAIAMVLKLGMAANYTVGAPNGGWDTNTDLQSWASSRSFLAGDNLIFQYGPNHSVLEVSKADHDSCQTNNAIQTHSDGNTLIPLSSPGKRYFICGTPGHCTQGMKLEIDVLATSAPPPASPTTPPPTTSPSPTNPPSPPTSPVTPVSSPSPKSSAPVISPPSPTESPLSPPKAISPSPNVISSPPPPSSSANKNSLPIGFGLVLMVLLAF